MTCITSAYMCISSLWSVFANVRHISSYFFAKSQAWHGRAYQLGKAGIWGFWLFNGGWCLAITGALNVLQSQSWGELRNLRRWWIHMNGAFGTGSRLDGINLRYLGERLILIYYAKNNFSSHKAAINVFHEQHGMQIWRKHALLLMANSTISVTKAATKSRRL